VDTALSEAQTEKPEAADSYSSGAQGDSRAPQALDPQATRSQVSAAAISALGARPANSAVHRRISCGTGDSALSASKPEEGSGNGKAKEEHSSPPTGDSPPDPQLEDLQINTEPPHTGSRGVPQPFQPGMVLPYSNPSCGAASTGGDGRSRPPMAAYNVQTVVGLPGRRLLTSGANSMSALPLQGSQVGGTSRLPLEGSFAGPSGQELAVLPCVSAGHSGNNNSGSWAGVSFMGSYPLPDYPASGMPRPAITTSMGEVVPPNTLTQAASGIGGHVAMSGRLGHDTLQPEGLQQSYSQVGGLMGGHSIRPGLHTTQHYHAPPPFRGGTHSLPQHMPMAPHHLSSRPSLAESRPNSAPTRGVHYSSDWGHRLENRAHSGVPPHTGGRNSNFLGRRQTTPEEATECDSGGLLMHPQQAASGVWGDMLPYSSPADPSMAVLEQQQPPQLLQQQARRYYLQGRGAGGRHGRQPQNSGLAPFNYEQPQMARIEGIHGDRPQLQMASIDSHRPLVGIAGAPEVLQPLQPLLRQDSAGPDPVAQPQMASIEEWPGPSKPAEHLSAGAQSPPRVEDSANPATSVHAAVVMDGNLSEGDTDLSSMRRERNDFEGVGAPFQPIMDDADTSNIIPTAGLTTQQQQLLPQQLPTSSHCASHRVGAQAVDMDIDESPGDDPGDPLEQAVGSSHRRSTQAVHPATSVHATVMAGGTQSWEDTDLSSSHSKEENPRREGALLPWGVPERHQAEVGQPSPSRPLAKPQEPFAPPSRMNRTCAAPRQGRVEGQDHCPIASSAVGSKAVLENPLGSAQDSPQLICGSAADAYAPEQSPEEVKAAAELPQDDPGSAHYGGPPHVHPATSVHATVMMDGSQSEGNTDLSSMRRATDHRGSKSGGDQSQDAPGEPEISSHEVNHGSPTPSVVAPALATYGSDAGMRLGSRTNTMSTGGSQDRPQGRQAEPPEQQPAEQEGEALLQNAVQQVLHPQLRADQPRGCSGTLPLKNEDNGSAPTPPLQMPLYEGPAAVAPPLGMLTSPAVPSNAEIQEVQDTVGPHHCHHHHHHHPVKSSTLHKRGHDGAQPMSQDTGPASSHSHSSDSPPLSPSAARDDMMPAVSGTSAPPPEARRRKMGAPATLAGSPTPPNSRRPNNGNAHRQLPGPLPSVAAVAAIRPALHPAPAGEEAEGGSGTWLGVAVQHCQGALIEGDTDLSSPLRAQVADGSVESMGSAGAAEACQQWSPDQTPARAVMNDGAGADASPSQEEVEGAKAAALSMATRNKTHKDQVEWAAGAGASIQGGSGGDSRAVDQDTSAAAAAVSQNNACIEDPRPGDSFTKSDRHERAAGGSRVAPQGQEAANEGTHKPHAANSGTSPQQLPADGSTNGTVLATVPASGVTTEGGHSADSRGSSGAGNAARRWAGTAEEAPCPSAAQMAAAATAAAAAMSATTGTLLAEGLPPRPLSGRAGAATAPPTTLMASASAPAARSPRPPPKAASAAAAIAVGGGRGRHVLGRGSTSSYNRLNEWHAPSNGIIDDSHLGVNTAKQHNAHSSGGNGDGMEQHCHRNGNSNGHRRNHHNLGNYTSATSQLPLPQPALTVMAPIGAVAGIDSPRTRSRAHSSFSNRSHSRLYSLDQREGCTPSARTYGANGEGHVGENGSGPAHSHNSAPKRLSNGTECNSAMRRVEGKRKRCSSGENAEKHDSSITSNVS